MSSFRDLLVWQKSMDLADVVYRLTRSFPREETFGLAAQLRRSAVSISSNIAEGQGRSSSREFKQFLNIARGSLCELQTQLEIAQRAGLALAEELGSAAQLSHEVGKLLYLLARSIRAAPKKA